ncbi:CDP-glycerol glycerophosphotransferase family protein [Niallia sp. XMNu-256]|uniref:bifunctional glycosyltransferase/CDP-glycerol:glycerophosphate glycerophosphotransferase n=1 Tax=Niallia sp. XMNu-256 TaxID=3082444 RepID=UPI0030CDE3A2
MEEMNEFKRDFYFSIVMAVYNVEEYLEEAIESLLKQTLNFEKYVQLILVNDGSLDNSKDICIKFKKKYPANVVFIDKENGGVSSARNAGLDKAVGKYINFLDPDDKLSPKTLENVYKFFEEKGNGIDVVSIPIFWFDQAKGKHLLNYKYTSNRIINILKEYKSIQMSSSSSFVRKSAIGNIRFNESLKYGEDAEWLNKIILTKCEYGVVKNARYLYRKRSTQTSATQRSLNDKDYYLHSLNNFSFSLINVSLEKLSFVPEYIQYMLMYDLQWRLNNNQIGTLMNAEETNQFLLKLRELLGFINDEVILAQTHLNLQRKNYLLRIKYNQSYNEFYHQFISPNNAALLHDNKVMNILGDNRLAIELINIEGYELLVEGHFTSLFENEEIKLVALFGNRLYEAESVDRFYKDVNVFGETINKAKGFKFKIPLSIVEENGESIQFLAQIKETKVPLNVIFASKSFISAKGYSYYKKNGYIISYNNKINKIIIEKSNLRLLLRKELALQKQLFKINKIGSRKAMLVRLIFLIREYFSKQPIWLFMDRVNKADDNAEVLFEYSIKQNDDIKKYFVINKDCEDYVRLKQIGKVIPYGSRKHKMYMLLADKVISSHADEFIVNPFGKMKKYYKDLLNFDYIFLQHGITKDDISDWLNKYKKNIRLFITAANKEYESIVNGHYDYDKKEVVLSGFPRFDKLKDEDKKRILIMPTWRSNLVAKINPITGERQYNPLFKESTYFKAFNDLLKNKELINAAKENDYKIVFFPHPNIMQQLSDYQIDSSIEVADINSSYRNHFNQSSILITDYSSVAFDFAYMKKPVIYYQFESNHLEQGYFDYEKMGFGTVLKESKDVADRIIEYMNNECEMENKYKERVNQFYSYTDSNNSKRVYDAIKEINKN